MVRWHQNSNVNVCQWTSLDVGMQIGTVYRLFFANGVSLYLNNLEVFPIRFCQMKCISAFCRSLCILCPFFGDNHTAFSGNQAHIPTSETTIVSLRSALEERWSAHHVTKGFCGIRLLIGHRLSGHIATK